MKTQQGELQFNSFFNFLEYFMFALILWCWKLLMKSQELSGRESITAAQVTFSFSSNYQKWSHFLTELSNEPRKGDNWESNLSMQTGRFPLTLGWTMWEGEKKKKKTVIYHSCHSSSTGAIQLDISKLLLSAGICWQLDLFGRVKCPGLACEMSPSLPSFTPLPPHTLWNNLSATLGCTDNILVSVQERADFPLWPRCHSRLRVFVCVC